MIALIGVAPPPNQQEGTVIMDGVPSVPASAFSAAVIRCQDAVKLESVLMWYADTRELRPGFPMALVCPPDACAGPLAAFTHPVQPFLVPTDLREGALPPWALDEVRSASVEGRLLDEILEEHGSVLLGVKELVACLITYAVAGGTVRRAAKAAGVSEDTVQRQLRMLGLQPRDFMRWARLRAYDLRLQQGVDSATALAGGNWTTQDARKKCLRRMRTSKRFDAPLRQTGGGRAAT